MAQVATILVSLNSRTMEMTSAKVASSTRSALFTRIRSASLSWYSNRWCMGPYSRFQRLASVRQTIWHSMPRALDRFSLME